MRQEARPDPVICDSDMQESLLSLSESLGGNKINVISGQRTQEEQNRERAAGNPRAAQLSQHTVGIAADFTISGMSNRAAAAEAYNSGLFSRTNLYTQSGAVHVDFLGNDRLYFEDWQRRPRGPQ